MLNFLDIFLHQNSSHEPHFPKHIFHTFVPSKLKPNGMMKNRRIFLLFIPLLLISVFACTPQKRLIYMQGSTADSSLLTKAFDYRLQARDVLMIQVQSSDEVASRAFNTVQTTMAQTSVSANSDGSNLALTGYIVNDSGYVELPVVGATKVSGLMVEEAQKEILKAVRRYVTDAWVSVRLVSFKITLLGEVNRPGIYRTYENRLNLLDALGMAGDLTEYGNRQQIALIRQQGEKRVITYLDITKRNIIESEAFNLLPNDVIYVPSLKAKSWGFSNAITPITLSLSLISTTILIINFITK